MTTIRNQVTYTQQIGSTRYENQTVLYRPYHLTTNGAQRILRRDLHRSTAIVTSVQGMICNFQS